LAPSVYDVYALRLVSLLSLLFESSGTVAREINCTLCRFSSSDRRSGTDYVLYGTFLLHLAPAKS
jgi:hypothetical protein